MDYDSQDSGLISEDDALNQTAYYAVLGFSTARERDLARLLRSDKPIHRLVREVLADALDGISPYGSALKFSGAKHLRDMTRAHEARREYMVIGRWIVESRAAGTNYETAIEEASNHFRCSSKKCESALTYKNRVDAWIEKNHSPETYYGSWKKESLEEYFHGFDLSGQCPPPNRDAKQYYRDQNETVMRLLSELGYCLTPNDLSTLSDNDIE